QTEVAQIVVGGAGPEAEPAGRIDAQARLHAVHVRIRVVDVGKDWGELRGELVDRDPGDLIDEGVAAPQIHVHALGDEVIAVLGGGALQLDVVVPDQEVRGKLRGDVRVRRLAHGELEAIHGLRRQAQVGAVEEDRLRREVPPEVDVGAAGIPGQVLL